MNTQNAISNEQKFASSERRYLPRWEAQGKLFYRKEKDEVPAQACSKDINASGMCFNTNDDISLDQKLDLVVYLAEDIEPIDAVGRVVWQSKSEKGNLFGVRFERISKKSQDLVFNYAFEYKRDQLKQRWFKDCWQFSPSI